MGGANHINARAGGLRFTAHPLVPVPCALSIPPRRYTRFAQGTFRWVAKATYTGDRRAGETYVIKWCKAEGVMEERSYTANPTL